MPYVFGFLRRAPWRALGLLTFLPALLLFALGWRDHGQLKSAFIRHTLRGCLRAQIELWSREFVDRLLAGRAAGGVFRDALEQLARHRAAGARLILLSASTDLYVPEIGRALGFAQVICTGVRWDGERLDGHLTTANRRGAEKVRCFLELRQQYPDFAAAAYGNTATDLPHLRLADRPLLVNGSARARRQAALLGVPCASWH